MVQILNDRNLTSILNKNDVVVVDFYADWCEPCQLLKPTLEEISETMAGKALISRIDVDLYPEQTKLFDIKKIPTLVYFKRGKLVSKQVKFHTKFIIKEYINQLIG